MARKTKLVKPIRKRPVKIVKAPTKPPKTIEKPEDKKDPDLEYKEQWSSAAQECALRFSGFATDKFGNHVCTSVAKPNGPDRRSPTFSLNRY